MLRHLLRIGLLTAVIATNATAADWPQWRGPTRTNVSAETGLLTEWPKDGPPLGWKATGLGTGVTPPAVAGGSVYLLGYRGEDEYCAALSEADGKERWAVKIGPAVKEIALMRHLSQRSPTVGDGRVYAVSAAGTYVALDAKTGREIWRKEAADFEAPRHIFGFCDYPLIDGDRLIVTPGGEKATVVALDRKTGKEVWRCGVPDGGTHGHSVLIPVEVGGARQYVNHTSKKMVAVSADGKLLWSYDGMNTRTATSHAPVAEKDGVSFASGYGAGHVRLKPEKKAEGWSVQEVYRHKSLPYAGWLGSNTPVGEFIYVNASDGLRRLDRGTGELVWKHPTGRMTYTVADGRFYIWLQTGTMMLAAADGKGLNKSGEFQPFAQLESKYGVTFPVVANGRLYLRDEGTLQAYDVRQPERPKDKQPDAVFVPTPPDVVTAMLDLAKVGKGDVVYDLGSGDGRIVIAAAKAYGSRAVGIELDAELVTLSRRQAEASGVQKRVTFEKGDLFETDFSSATVVALYILPSMSEKLIPKFDKLPAGVRIVSHAFAIPGLKPQSTVQVRSSEDDIERPVFLYKTPLQRQTAK